MGSIHPYSTKAGKRYLVRYFKPDLTHGAKRGFKTKRDAELWLAEAESSQAKGDFFDPQAGRITVEMIGEPWLAAKRASMKPSSFAPIEAAWRLRVRPRWGRVSVADVRFTDVKAWVAKLSAERGATVTIRTFGVLASILDDAVQDGRLPRNPARAGRVGLPRKGRGEHRYLTHEQVHRLAAAAGSRRLIILVLAYMGLRWSELVGLRVKHIDFERGRVRVSENAVEVQGVVHVGTTKSNKPRFVPVPGFILKELATHTEGQSQDALVFPNGDGSHMRRLRSSEGSKSWFKSALAEAGLERMTIHDLRHTAASLAIQSGAHVKTVQRMLGHASAAMTLDIYADLFDTDLDSVARALDKAARRARTGD
jgi:integrase